ncbi:MAG: hypothetical protein M3270_11515 [Thermoproteota archaeon]|nr:hypothetical protein [Thermoproteota archaeon]
MVEYSKLTAKRYRRYLEEEKNQSLSSELISLILQLVHALVRTLQQLGIRKTRVVQKIDVE